MAGICLEHLEYNPVPLRWILHVSGAWAGASVEAGRASTFGLHRIVHTVGGTAGGSIRLAIFGADPMHTTEHQYPANL